MVFCEGFRDFKDSRRERSPGIPYNNMRERAYSAVRLAYPSSLSLYLFFKVFQSSWMCQSLANMDPVVDFIIIGVAQLLINRFIDRPTPSSCVNIHH